MFSFKLKGRSKSGNSSTASTDSALSSNNSGMLSSQTLVAPPPKRSKGGKGSFSPQPTLPDYAEMLEDENMSWGPPKSRRR
ncbi:hypothetical protein H4582DRAFT_2077890 [Lactarius indigo]|nr:hypothetical protein H4582DRAFT_2077890 [Lactarius indigo]